MTVFHTPDAAAERFGRSRDFVMRMARTGEWPHHRFGQSVRFSDADLEQIEELTRVTPAGQSAASKRRRRSA